MSQADSAKASYEASFDLVDWIMDFVASYFVLNKSLGSYPFLSSKLDFPVIKTLVRHSLNIKRVSPMFWSHKNLILMKEVGNWSELHL